MYCSKCGNKTNSGEKFCNKCGNILGDNVSNQQNNNNILLIVIGGVLIFLILVLISVFIYQKNHNYDYANNTYQPDNDITTNSSNTVGQYKTAIITDNVYYGVEVTTKEEAKDLIIKDSVSQKDKCPDDILKIENEIIKKYNITAVNLCELDLDFAKEIENVLETIYKEYPSIKGYLTNLSLTNANFSENYIAVFMPMFNFTKSSTSSTYPWSFKMQILLNTTYYLNPQRLDYAVKNSSASGHFPPNATKYSPVAHEMGHYLSFLTLMKSHNIDSTLLIDENNLSEVYETLMEFSDDTHSYKLIQEAYQNYQNDTNDNIEFDKWRATISSYAVAKDNEGNYIYDETIAEAFHDVYLNKDNATSASKYVVSVLKKHLES